jgi:hypothetical protein
MQHRYQSRTKNFHQEILFFLFSSSTHEAHNETMPLTGYDNVPHPPEKKKISSPIKKLLTKDEPLLENYMNIEQQQQFASPKRTQIPTDNAPILMPKKHTPIKNSFLNKQHEFVHSEHYQLPPNGDDDDDYQPPLPPKQRHQHNTSRAMVYDFIGSELQELRVALAQFDGNSSSKF